MDVNPYASPPIAATKKPRGTWRARFRRLCLWSLAAFAICFVAGETLELQMPRNEFDASPLFLIVRGFIAFGELSGLTATGLFGVGWALSPRPKPMQPPIN
jgi:hypothetical protein